MSYINTCLNCGENFEVKTKSQNDPTNKSKFKRACSKDCTNALKSKNMSSLHGKGKLKRDSGQILTELDKETLVDMYSYKHMKLEDIAKELGVKFKTLRREMDRLNVPKVFYRKCPQCEEYFECKMRSQTDESSNKFKKFCTRACFLSSRKQCDTWIEREVEKHLKSEGVDFEKQFEVGRMTIDFLIKDKNIALEVNGDFWHANPEIYGKTKPLHKIHDRVRDKDERKTNQLEELGYEVVVVWEKDLADNLESTLSDLTDKLCG